MSTRFREARRSADEFHPKFRPVLRVFKVMRTVLLGTVIGIAAMFLVLYLKKPDPTLLAAGGVTILVMLVVFIVIDRVLVTTVKPRLERANRLMNAVRAHPMRMHPLGLAGMQGHLVELKDRNARDESPPWGIASVNTSGRRYLSRKPQDVLVYHDPTDPRRPLVVEGDAQVYWGTLTTPDARENSFRNMNRVLYVAIGMMALMGVVFYMVMDMELDEVRKNLQLAEQSAGWPAAPGIVTRSAVQETRIQQGKGSVRGYKAVVSYEYEVDGRQHVGGLIHFCYAPTRSVEHAESLAARYPRGATIPVAYDPAAPGVSVLEPGFSDPCRSAESDAFVQMLAIGLIIFLAAAVFAAMIWWFRSRRDRVAARFAKHGIRF